MKKSLVSLVFMALLATVAGATALPSAPADAALDLSLSDVLDTKPFWLDIGTTFICPPGSRPYPCSYDQDCQIYFGLPPNYVCNNPSGQLCGGYCERC